MGDIVRMLLRAPGIDVNAVNMFEGSALLEASCAGRRDVVELLLDANANVHQIGCAHETSLSLGTSNGHWEVVNLLLRAGAGHEGHITDGTL